MTKDIKRPMTAASKTNSYHLDESTHADKDAQCMVYLR